MQTRVNPSKKWLVCLEYFFTAFRNIHVCILHLLEVCNNVCVYTVYMIYYGIDLYMKSCIANWDVWELVTQITELTNLLTRSWRFLGPLGPHIFGVLGYPTFRKAKQKSSNFNCHSNHGSKGYPP